MVRPLTSLFAQTRHPGILHALLLCRHHFLDAADDELAFQGGFARLLVVDARRCLTEAARALCGPGALSMRVQA